MSGLALVIGVVCTTLLGDRGATRLTDEEMGTLYGTGKCVTPCYLINQTLTECRHSCSASEPIPREEARCLVAVFNSWSCSWNDEGCGTDCETSDDSSGKSKCYQYRYTGVSCTTSETTWNDWITLYDGCSPNCDKQTFQKACTTAITCTDGTEDPTYWEVGRGGTRQVCDDC